MEEISIVARFLDKFFKGLIPNLREKVLDIILLVGTLIYQGRHGRLSAEAWKQNVWEAATPWIWLICVLAAYHVLKAARSLHSELRDGLYDAKKPLVILTDSEQSRVIPNYQYKIAGITTLSLLLLMMLSYVSWRFAQTVTDSGTFIADESMSFVNMSQSLTTYGSGWWWVTYKSGAGDTASPVALVQYMEITNLLSRPETIRTYSLAVRTECGWTYLTPIDLQTVSVWWTYEGLEHARQMDFRDNGLDYALQKPIPAFGTITGFWFFGSKMKCDVPIGSKIQYRVVLSTFSGLRFEHTTPELIVKNEVEPNLIEGRTNGPHLRVLQWGDISKLYRTLR